MIQLKKAREDRGVKQLSVAKALGVTRQTYASYEAHPESMSVEQAKVVCEFLGYSVNDIFFKPEVN